MRCGGRAVLRSEDHVLAGVLHCDTNLAGQDDHALGLLEVQVERWCLGMRLSLLTPRVIVLVRGSHQYPKRLRGISN